MKAGTNSKGSSLLEMMLTTSLLLIVISVAYSLFIPGLYIMHRAQNKMEAQQNAFKTLNSMGALLRDSAYSSFVFKKLDGETFYGEYFPLNERISIRAIAFMSASENGQFTYDDASGRAKWQKFVIYFLAEQDEVYGIQRYSLYRVEFKDSSYYLPSLSPQKIRSSDFNNLISDTKKAKLIAKDISKIEFFEPSLGQIGILINTCCQTPDRRGVESTITTRILLRN